MPQKPASAPSNGGGKLAPDSLMHPYYFYSAILALKLLFLKPIAGLLCDPERALRANLSDLKNLTPFWLLAALYMTTSPNPTTAVALLRIFTAARFVAAYGYIQPIPRYAKEWAYFASFAVSSFMGIWVVYTYKYHFLKTNANLLQAYALYSAILALKLLFLKPLASWLCCCSRSQVLHANLSDLKHLTPFWLVAAIYMTTAPDVDTAKALLRLYVGVRFLAAYGYVYWLPKGARKVAFFTSISICIFMGFWAVYYYGPSL